MTDMLRLMKKVSKKAGLPPGSLIHVGEKKTEEAQIQVFDYNEKELEERDVDTIEEASAYRNKRSVTWINVNGIHQPDVTERVGAAFDLHPLILEDILNTTQRPKMDDLDDYLYISLKMLRYNESESLLETEQVSLVLGRNFVVSFQESAGDVFDPVRERLRKAKGRIRKRGADYLIYALMDAVVDNYFVVLEKVGEDIEGLEEELISDPGPQTARAIHHLRRELIFLRRSVWPLREIIAAVERGDSKLVKEKTRIYFKDVYDHTIHVAETIETFRDMVAGMLDVYLSAVSNRMNQVMKVLTIIATIFIPLTFLAGVYGMNFKHMPELEWPYGYPLLWLVMIGVGVSMFVYFKKKKWF
jgi:magnesium transporter